MSYKNKNVPEELNTALWKIVSDVKKKKNAIFKTQSEVSEAVFHTQPWE